MSTRRVSATWRRRGDPRAARRVGGRLAGSPGQCWRAFWFADVDVTVFALLRIGVGAVVLAWALTLVPDLGAFFSTHGLVGGAQPPHRPWDWSPLSLWSSDFAVGAVFVALLSSGGALLVGWHSRLSALVVFLALTTLLRADPYVFNSGDSLLRLLAFFVALAPAGARLSLDHRRALARGTPAPAMHAAWPLRLIQIQVSLMYLGAVASKLHGQTWRDGTAVAYALQLTDLTRLPAPEIVTNWPLAAAAATYGTILVEAALAVLLWPRRTRMLALATGAGLHLSLDLLLRVGFFSLAVLIAYVSFLEPYLQRARVFARAHSPERSPTR